MATADIHIKIDSDIKSESENVLKKIGISMSDLVNMTLRRVIYERRIPFDTQIPEVEMPENISINSMDELQYLLKNRIENDSGERYTMDDVKLHLKERRKEIEGQATAYA